LEGTCAPGSMAAGEKTGTESGTSALLQHGGPEHLPRHIWPQVLASHTGLALDYWTEFGRDRAIAAEQLTDELRASANGRRESGAVDLGFDRASDGFIHAPTIKHCCMSEQALADRSIGRENKAMLDTNSTNERLKANLASAFSAWQALAPRTNTKAELARQCQRLSARACTPQTVSGWFKTGRMDKAWLPVLEQILRAPLGFSSRPIAPQSNENDPLPVAPSADELAAVLHFVARAVREADVVSKASILPLFSMMADPNVESGLIARQLSFLLSRSLPSQQSPETQRPEESAQDFTITVNEASDGTADSTEEEERRRRGLGGAAGGNSGGSKTR